MESNRSVQSRLSDLSSKRGCDRWEHWLDELYRIKELRNKIENLQLLRSLSQEQTESLTQLQTRLAQYTS
jgi:hypothetical protein